MPIPDGNADTNGNGYFLPPSVAALALPIAAGAAPRLELARDLLEQHAADLLRGPRAHDVLLKDPNLPCSACPRTQRPKRAMGNARELDWAKVSATAVDVRAA